jgi:calcineurin-like phosphoesterase family protein
MTNIYFVSDNHYFHKNIQKFCPDTRKGKDVSEMNEMMIDAHNERVRPNDTVYFLGDFSFGQAQETKSVIRRLNGQKHLILGNHDKVIRGDKSIQDMFETVQDYKTISIEKIKIVMFHYPMREWESMHYGAYHLFGHVHGNLVNKPHGRSMDVGIDTRPTADMAPWSFEEIHRELRNKEVLSHHGD